MTVGNAVPWCGTCEWNLDSFEVQRRQPELAWTWQDRIAFRSAYRRNRATYESLAGRPIVRGRTRFAHWFSIAASAVTLAITAGLLGLGGYLLAYRFPSLALVPGAALVGLAFLMRPRVGRFPRGAATIEAESMPTLWRLVVDVAAALGTAPPTVILTTNAFRVSARTLGLFRRRVLVIGVPMWGALGPQQRVAAVAAALSRLVARDVTAGVLTGHALASTGALAASTAPSKLRRERFTRRGSSLQTMAALTDGLLAVFHQFATALHIGVSAVGRASAQTTAYRADALAAEVAGTDAMAQLLDIGIGANSHLTLIRLAAHRRGPAAEWRSALAGSDRSLAASMPARRQLTVRDEASLFADVAPAGLRARLLLTRPGQTARVVLTGAESDRIDVEMERVYTRYMNEVKPG